MEQKSPDAFRTISEVAEWLGVPTHVLRFWESRFTQVKPVKRAGGRRYYRPSDMELLGGIRKLLHEDGMTIRGVQKLLREEGVKHVAAMSPSLDLDAADEDASNVVSLSEHARSTEAEIEDAEVVEDDETTLAVDEAIEDGAVAPVEPEEDRPVTYGTGDEAGPAEVEAEAPTLSDETAYDTETPERVDEATAETPFGDPLETAQSVEDAPDEALLDESFDAGEDSADETLEDETEAEVEPTVEMVTSGTLPEDEAPWALDSNEPEATEAVDAESALFGASEGAEATPVPSDDDTAAEPSSEWDPAIEVSGADDSDIAAPFETEVTNTEEPNLTRAAPLPTEDSGIEDTADSPEPQDEAPDLDEVDAARPDPHDAEQTNIWADSEPQEPAELAAHDPEPDHASEISPVAEDAPFDDQTDADQPAPMPIDAGYSDYAPVLVMPDIDDDPADGTLPPLIAPLGPRLRHLRMRGLNLPPAHLSALSDRLKTLGGEPNDGVLR